MQDCIILNKIVGLFLECMSEGAHRDSVAVFSAFTSMLVFSSHVQHPQLMFVFPKKNIRWVYCCCSVMQCAARRKQHNHRAHQKKKRTKCINLFSPANFCLKL